jgi:hypothetical protein
MGTSLINTKPQDTYPGLIKTTDNAAISATLKTLSDGNGNDFPMQISTTAVNFTGTLTQNGSPVTTPPSGVSGAIQFSNGSAFASDATNFFWDDTNNRLGVGTNAPSATGHFKGSGSTSATRSFLVQNSAGATAFEIFDNRLVRVANGLDLNGWYLYPSGDSNAKMSGGTGFAFEVVAGGTYVFYSTSATNGTMSIGKNANADASSKLEVASTTSGFLPPRMTTTQKNAITSPAAGLIVYDTTLAKLCVRTTSAWETITSI